MRSPSTRPMSFRARLTSFFVLIVVIPMAATGVMDFRLIDDSQTGKAQARVEGIASAAASVYTHASAQASADARSIAQELALTPVARIAARVKPLLATPDIARVAVSVAGRLVVALGADGAVAPGFAVVPAAHGRPGRVVGVSELTAAQYGHELAGDGIQVVVRSSGNLLASTLPAAGVLALPRTHGAITIGSETYQALTHSFAGFDGSTDVSVSVLSTVSA